MYDELVKRLRICATEAGACKTCELDSNPSCTDYMMKQAADAIEELQAQLMYSNDAARAIAEKVPRWIPVTERLPENDQDVLVMVHWRDYPEDMMCYGRKYKTRWYLWNGELGEILKGFDITHWMPLPEPPKEESYGV